MKLEYEVEDLIGIATKAIVYYHKEYEINLNKDKIAEQSIKIKVDDLKNNASFWRRWWWRNKEYKYNMLACKELGYSYWSGFISEYKIYEYQPEACDRNLNLWKNVLVTLEETISDTVWLTDEEFLPYAKVKRLIDTK